MDKHAEPIDIPKELDRIRAELSLLQRSGRMAPKSEYEYGQDFKAFSRWCLRMQLCSRPATPETLSLYIADLMSRGLQVRTVTRYAAGVAYFHVRQGLESPFNRSVRDTLWAARRLKMEQPRQMIPLTVEQLREMAAVLAREATLVAIRNRAIILIGFASALRCSNLSSMQLQDLTFLDEGIEICVKREKNNQAGPARFVAIPFGCDPVSCPVKALNAWLDHRGRGNGALFQRLDTGPARSTGCKRLSPYAILKIVKATVAKIGINSDQYGPHSLRAGLITAAGQSGVSHLVIAAHSGHHSLASMQGYFRPTDRFKRGANAAAATGL
jgi:integrase